MRKIISNLVTPVIVIAFLTGYSFGFEKVGTTSAQFLQIGIGGKLTAMGGAGVAIVSGPDALYWNPAGIVESHKLEFGIYYADWIADLRHQFIGLTVPVSEKGVLGIHGISLGGDEFEQTTLSFQEGNGVMVEYGDLALGATYAHRLTERFSFGGTFKYIHQKLFHETASTFAIDLGSRLDTDLEGFSIGMSMTNLGGSMTLKGRDLLTSGPEETAEEYQVSDWPLPLMFQVGAAWKLLGVLNSYWKNADHGITVLFDGKHINEGMTRWHAGIEYGFKRMIFLRAGKVFEHYTEDWTFGGGIQVPLGDYALAADFAYADMGDLDIVQRVSFTIKWK